MVAYLIVTMTVHDPETLRKYTSVTPPIVQRFGGRFLTRGTPVISAEGEPFSGRMVILEFPSAEKAQEMLADPEYVEASKFRLEATTSRLLIQEGIPNTYDPEPHV